MSTQQQQTFNLFLLLLLGIFFSDFYLKWYEVGVILLFTVLTVYLIHLSWDISYYFSSLSTSIGIILMMVSSSFWIYFVLIILALFQKKYLLIHQKHLFNPSNFALVMALFLFYDDAHIVLGQLGTAWWLMGIVVLLGTFILIRVNRWLISLSFIFFYLLFQYFLVVGYDPILLIEDVYYRFYSVSFILFIFFMLTDPKTTPSSYAFQLLFAFLIALITVLLDRYNGFRVQHLFLSLFLFTPSISFLVSFLEKFSKILLLRGSFILFFVMAVIITIEMKAPYYFIMSR